MQQSAWQIYGEDLGLSEGAPGQVDSWEVIGSRASSSEGKAAGPGAWHRQSRCHSAGGIWNKSSRGRQHISSIHMLRDFTSLQLGSPMWSSAGGLIPQRCSWLACCILSGVLLPCLALWANRADLGAEGSGVVIDTGHGAAPQLSSPNCRFSFCFWTDHIYDHTHMHHT